MSGLSGRMSMEAPGPGGAASGLPLVGQLLAHAASGVPLPGANLRFGWRPHGRDERQFRWAMDGGLGPLLHRAAALHIEAIPAAWREALLAADLTARVRHGSLIDTTLDILAVGERLGIEVTLLKGISVSEQFYPAAHLRPMSDVDVLIPATAYARLEAGLLERGYGRLPYSDLAGHHHGAPLRHRRRRTVVELHTALFPQSAPLHGHVFGRVHVETQTRVAPYHGRPARRLSDELQLVYIAASWFNDMTKGRFHPSFLASLFDGVFLMKACGRALDWNGLPDWIDNDMVKASLYAMLSYLPRFGVEPAPPAMLARLADNRGRVGPIQRRLIHAALDRYLIGARAWPFPWPPPVPGRYSPLYQFEKRILGRLHEG
jgi:hypothetical protein